MLKVVCMCLETITSMKDEKKHHSRIDSACVHIATCPKQLGIHLSPTTHSHPTITLCIGDRASSVHRHELSL